MTWNEPINGWELVAGFFLSFVAAWVGALIALGHKGLGSRADLHWKRYWNNVYPFWEFDSFDPDTRRMTIKNARRTARRIEVRPMAVEGFGLDDLIVEKPLVRAGEKVTFDLPERGSTTLDSHDVGGVRILFHDARRPRWWNWWSHFDTATPRAEDGRIWDTVRSDGRPDHSRS